VSGDVRVKEQMRPNGVQMRDLGKKGGKKKRRNERVLTIREVAAVRAFRALVDSVVVVATT